MTVQKDVTKNIYVGNGSTRTFPFTFECPAEHPEYIKVYLMQDDGTALATSDYQLDMDARQITYPSSGTALPEGKKLVIMRELPLQQMMNLVNNGPYFAEDVETAFDENVMAMQQIAEKLNRSIIMSVDIDGDAFVNEVPFEAGKSFRIADDGKSIVLTEDPARVLPLAQEAYAQAQAQAQSASASAAAAAKSEDSAAASASEAGNSAQSASTSAAGAAESARLAEGYKNVAETAKSDASLYADNAKTSADNATASKEVAQSAANSASNFATDARRSVSEAKSYRDAASTYATNAKNYSENVNVFVPHIDSSGILTWTNKAGLDNPSPITIKGIKGDPGEKGEPGQRGEQGAQGIQGPRGIQGEQGERGVQGAQGPAGTAATITIGNVTTSAPGTSAQVTNRGTSSAAVLDFVLPKGKDGADGGVTVDEELSSTSTNPVQNKAIYNALLNKVGTDIFSGFTLLGGATKIMWREGTQFIGSINAANYNGTARAAIHDGDGNVITDTYTKKVDFDKTISELGVAFQQKADKSDLADVATSGKYTDLLNRPAYVVQSVNNVRPDTAGNVTIDVSGSNVTVDTTLSATSTNAIANKAVYDALNKKLDKTGTVYEATKATQDGYGNVITSTYVKKVDLVSYVKTVNNIAPDANGNVNVSGGSSNITIDTTLSATSTNPIANKTVYSALGGKLGKTETAYAATKATQDNAGNVITETYATKADISGVVKSVNGVQPDTNGNVSITVSGGSGVSTSTENTWTAQQNFQKMKFNFESYNAPRISGATDNPAESVAVYNVQGNFTLDMSVLAGLLNNGDATLFTAYITANGSYTLSITNAGTLKYAGSANDLAITANGLLLNILLIKSSSGVLSSVAQASTLS